MPMASLNAPSDASQEGHPGCRGSPCLSPANLSAAWPSVSEDGLLPGTDGVHPAVPLPCQQPATEEATLPQPLVSPVTPFSTSLALTPLHMVVSFQCPPVRTVPSGWPAQLPCSQKSTPFGKEKTLLFFRLFGREVGFPHCPPGHHPVTLIGIAPKPGSLPRACLPLTRLQGAFRAVHLILFYPPNPIPLSQASPSPTRKVGPTAAPAPCP